MRYSTVLFALAWSVMSVSAGVVSGPTLVLDPNELTPLAARLDLETDVPTRVTLRISSMGESHTVSFPHSATHHELPVLGMKPDRTYTVDIRLDTGELLPPQLVTTAPLPADFPVIETLVSVPEAMEPGFTLLDCFSRGGDPRPRWTVVLDPAGEVVWYSSRCLSGVRMLPHGKLEARTNQSVTMNDMLGNQTTITLQDPGEGLHHDLERTSAGTLLSLSTRGVEVESFPGDYFDPGASATTIVRDEPVVEFFSDGTLRREWSLLEMLDEHRIGFDSLNESDDGVDWVHTNAVVYGRRDDSIVVSGRHQDAVFKFSRDTGELEWILANHDNWSPEFLPYLLTPINTPFEWQYHQHAPMWTDRGTLLLFDNGNRRASPFTEQMPQPATESYSRGVEYRIDERASTVEQLWEFGADAQPSLFSFFISDADWMRRTGNRLMTFGGTSHVGGIPGVDIGLGTIHTRVIEATDETPATRVFEIAYYDAEGGAVAVYRAERIPSLYPTEYLLAPVGVGDTVQVSLVGEAARIFWQDAPEGPGHSRAEWYTVRASEAPDAGFGIVESVEGTTATIPTPGAVTYFKVVAENLAGTSGDEPPGRP